MRRRFVVTKTSALLLGAGAAAFAAWRLAAQRRTRSLLRRKTVFITGGSRGLGFILAQEFARCGSNVVISARDAEELARAEVRIRQITPNVLAIPADVTMREEAEAAVQKTVDRFGEVDVLVNNAGTISVGPAETMTIDDSIPGVYGGFLDKVPFGAAFNKGLTLKMGQTHMQRYMQPLLARVAQDEIDPSFVITHRLPLDAAPSAYRTFRDKQDKCIKVVLDPWRQSNGSGHYAAAN